MTGPIKRVGGSPTIGETEAPEAASPSADFREALRPGETSASGASASGASASRGAAPIAGGTKVIAEAVRRGELTTEQAIETLLAKAMTAAAGLDGPRRAELERLLRDALENDPVLVALKGDMDLRANEGSR